MTEGSNKLELGHQSYLPAAELSHQPDAELLGQGLSPPQVVVVVVVVVIW